MKEENGGKVIPVRVAVRIRPLNSRETREGCQNAVEITPGSSQVVVCGTEKAFTYDFAYPPDTSQGYVYETAVKNVVQNLFKGYNVTVLAYGQTGSGKTHTMGTAYSQGDEREEGAGIIPRAVTDIFEGVAQHTDCEYMVKVSFIELYKENVFDLLGNKSRDDCVMDIREDPRGGIKMVGLTEVHVTSLHETMRCLEQGATNRATGATAMNAHSSRSHAIFSLYIEQRNKAKGESIVSSKFHLVDLAGSERAKKTGATGERFKEGVNINRGLLALGNVISALGEEGHRGHIPYRDSKLTRLLQDSLGGNSHTVMVACVSPADSNLEETLSTLRYADRARKIKNKPIINRDPQAAELGKLRNQVMQLQLQLLASKNTGEGGIVTATSEEMDAVMSRVKMLEDENSQLTAALQTALNENTNLAEKALLAEMSGDRMKHKLNELDVQTRNTVQELNKTLDVTHNPQYEDQINQVKALQAKVIEIKTEQDRGEKAIVEHELSRHNRTTAAGSQPGSPTQEGAEEGDNSLSEEEQQIYGTEYTLRQAKLNEELQGLNKALAMKEELMSTMSINDAQMVAMKSKYEQEKRELEMHINHLVKEKDELHQKLTVVSHGTANNKVSEQRRKRVQELEGQISSLRQKQKEQLKVIRMKEQSEKKVETLKSEIQGIKAARVKLIRQLKEDSEKFRIWKAKKDQEVAKLKQADRRKQYEIVKMKNLHSKQQNVMRRKMEETVAINKRLKDALAVHKAGAEKRAASKDAAGTGAKIRSWLDGELEVAVIKKQARHTLEMLVRDRKTITQEITKAKKQLKNEALSTDMAAEVQDRIKSQENDLQILQAQISDLQAKFVDDDEDAINKKRFESLQSMVEAKCATNFLFEGFISKAVTLASKETDMRDLQAQYEEVSQAMEELEAEIKVLKEKHQEEVTRLEREREEKVLCLLGHMPKPEGEVSTDDEEKATLRERIRLQEEAIAHFSSLHEQLVAKTKECDELKKKLTVSIATGGSSQLPMPNLSVPVVKRRTKFLEKSEPDWGMFSSDEDGEHETSDRENDPDWHKTPLFKKIRKIARSVKKEEDDDDNEQEEPIKKKRGVKRDSCGCQKGGCTSKLCNCKKFGRACSQSCRCQPLKCKNKDDSSPDSSTDSFQSSKEGIPLNTTFDTDAVLPLQENIFKRPRLSADIFLNTPPTGNL